jgi:hypothetical protein
MTIPPSFSTIPPGSHLCFNKRVRFAGRSHAGFVAFQWIKHPLSCLKSCFFALTLRPALQQREVLVRLPAPKARLHTSPGHRAAEFTHLRERPRRGDSEARPSDSMSRRETAGFVPERQCDLSPAIHRRVFGIRQNRVPEGRLGRSIVPPGRAV